MMTEPSGPYKKTGEFSSVMLDDTRGVIDLSTHIGITVHVSGGSRIMRRGSRTTRSFSPQFASSFIDVPGNLTTVSVQGRAGMLQSKLSIERIQLIASEDHDCRLQLEHLAPRQDVRDFDLFRLAACSRHTRQSPVIVERELVRRLIQLTGGMVVEWRGGLPPARLLQLERLVSDRFLDVTVNDMAKTAGLTIYHFTREFKRVTGVTPWTYIVKRKLEEAVKLLRWSSLAISVIAGLSGFSHGSHLSRHMQAQLHLTPAQLRRALR